MNVKALVGAGDRIMGVTLPVAIVGIVANVLMPAVFRTNLGAIGTVGGGVLLLVGVPIWLISAVQVLVMVPKRKLITRGPFALVLHPLYTSVALLVIPGLGLVLESWLGVVLGAVLYGASRRFAPREERELAEQFGAEYEAYRKRVLIPWL